MISTRAYRATEALSWERMAGMTSFGTIAAVVIDIATTTWLIINLQRKRYSKGPRSSHRSLSSIHAEDPWIEGNQGCRIYLRIMKRNWTNMVKPIRRISHARSSYEAI